MSEEITGGQPEGKGLAVGGFVIALVGLILATWIAAINAASMAATYVETGEMGGKGLMYFWLVLCLGSVVLSAMGMMKLGKTGGKKGLAIAGLVIGIVATLVSIMWLMGLDAAAEMVTGTSSSLEDALNNL